MTSFLLLFLLLIPLPLSLRLLVRLCLFVEESFISSPSSIPPVLSCLNALWWLYLGLLLHRPPLISLEDLWFRKWIFFLPFVVLDPSLRGAYMYFIPFWLIFGLLFADISKFLYFVSLFASFLELFLLLTVIYGQHYLYLTS